MNRSIVTLVCIALGACGGARSSPSVEGAKSKDGVYEFSAAVPATQQGEPTLRVNGTLSAFDDSLWVQPGSSECAAVTPSERYHTPSDDRVATVYCRGGARLTFDRRAPTSARWHMRVAVPKQRNTCAEYGPLPTNGNRKPCIRWRTETYYTYEQRSGAVQVKRIT